MGVGLPQPTSAPPPQTHLQRLMSSAEEACRSLAFSLALRSIQNNPRWAGCLPGAGELLGVWAGGRVPTACGSRSIAADFLPTFMCCLGSRDFEVVQTALRNLPEYTLLCQGQPRSAYGVGGSSGSPLPVELGGSPLAVLTPSPLEHAAALLHRAFLVGVYGQLDASSHISEALRALHVETVV